MNFQCAALTGVTGALADAFGLEVIGLAILVFTLILLALYEGFIRRGGSAALALSTAPPSPAPPNDVACVHG